MILHDIADYLHQLLALLPRGKLWESLAEDPVFAATCEAEAAEYARIDTRAGDLLPETDPRSTYELLAEWEAWAGLPSPCMSGIDQTIEQRRAALHAALTATGGQSPAYYIGVAAALGYTVTVTEFSPWGFDDPVDDPIYGEEWAYAWQINAPETTVTYWGFDDPVDEPLAWWGNELLECVIGRLKPAHTILIFAYG